MLTQAEIRAVLARATYFEGAAEYGHVRHDGTWALCPIAVIAQERGMEIITGTVRHHGHARGLYLKTELSHTARYQERDIWRDVCIALGFTRGYEGSVSTYLMTMQKEGSQFLARFQALLEEDTQS